MRSGEYRMQSFAYVLEAVLTVVHVKRDDALRIVSFRPASEEERSAYHDWLENDFNDARLDTTLPQLDINDPQAVADFIVDYVFRMATA